jgi:predicted TPR repeat methyltransferase
LDAGCGTGLCGPLLRPWAARLVGVDLSAGMLARARLRGTYDELIEAELTEYLLGQPAAFDVIAAADTLIYFGDLAPLLAAVAYALRPGGLLAFTVEHLSPREPGTDVQLHATGRYRHTEPYVRNCLERAGLSVSAVEHATLRTEGAQPVAGLVVLAQQSAS